MTMRAGIVSSGVLAILVALAVGLVFVRLDSGASKTATSADARPTLALGKPTNSLQGALNLAREIFTAAPPYVVHDIESVVYVETTAGQARAVFDPGGSTPAGRWFADAEDKSPVWVVVAEGMFRIRELPGSDTPGPTVNIVWVVTAQGEKGETSGAIDGTLDLSSLGTIVEVPVPLAEFPNPIQLQ